MSDQKIKKLEEFAHQIRVETLQELKELGFGHIGGSMSIIETLAVLYGEIMQIDPKNPSWEDRDYFVLSKGHAGPALYSTLALKGYFPLEMLKTLNQNATKLPSHPDRLLTIGVDATTGSLGQGISVAVGIALGNKLKSLNNYTYCIVGDGELNEGQCWEAIMFAAHQKLDNFILFIDENKKQLDGRTDDICQTFDFVNKLESFGFLAKRVKGDSIKEIYEKINWAKSQDKPVAIVLDTVKGQGISYFEKMESNHHVRFNDEDIKAIDSFIDQ
ncbi:transketolase [Orenia marismortui]|uniref:transketolase n=1 Tax=Orenia marismortui TaxID=46469 RepID=UPI0003821468|nr:transketolase [Orenia marismortui]